MSKLKRKLKQSTVFINSEIWNYWFPWFKNC